MSDLEAKLQTVLEQATSDPQKIPGAILYAADKDGNTLFHGASGVRELGKSETLDKNDVAWIASCTKLITAIAAMQLVERGAVKLDDPVTRHLPELGKLEILEGFDAQGKPQLRKPKVEPTLRMLLTHTAGQSYEFFNPNTLRYQEMNKASPSFSTHRSTILAPLATEPGTAWEYGTSLDWAGQLVERLSGQSLDEYFKNNIFDPLGIKNISFFLSKAQNSGRGLSGMHQRAKDGSLRARPHWMEQDEAKIDVLYGGAGLYANGSEYARVLVALLNNGVYPPTGGRILSEASTKELLRPQLSPDIVPDLDRPFQDAIPDLTPAFIDLEGVKKQWAFGGCLTPEGIPATGRSSGAVWWAGIANHYWFADWENGVCGMVQCQITPFFDANVLGLFGQLEAAVQEHAKAKRA